MLRRSASRLNEAGSGTHSSQSAVVCEDSWLPVRPDSRWSVDPIGAGPDPLDSIPGADRAGPDMARREPVENRRS